MWLNGWVLRIPSGELLMVDYPTSRHMSLGKVSEFSMLHFSLRKLRISCFLSIYVIVLINLCYED